MDMGKSATELYADLASPLHTIKRGILEVVDFYRESPENASLCKIIAGFSICLAVGGYCVLKVEPFIGAISIFPGLYGAKHIFDTYEKEYDWPMWNSPF